MYPSWNITSFFLVVSMIFAPLTVRAAERWRVPQETTLYTSPSFENISDDQLEPGVEIYVSSQVIRGFRHVLITPAANQKRKFAYILESDYQNWLKQRYESDRWAVWAGPIYSYVFEPPRSVTTNLDASYSISTFSGSSFFYALGASYKMSDQWLFRFGLIQRAVNITGSVLETDSGQTDEYRVTQSCIGALGGFRYTPADWQHWRLDLQAEFSQGEHVSLTTISGSAIDSSAVQASDYFILSAGFDYDWRFAKRWSFEPSLRVGANASVSPVILTLDGESDLAYSF